MLNTTGDRCTARAWTGDFDVHSTESGFGVGIEGLLTGTLSDRAHDLVMPTASALAGGIGPAARGVRAISFDDDVDASAVPTFL